MKKIINGRTYYIEKERRKVWETGRDMHDWQWGYGVYRVWKGLRQKDLIGFVWNIASDTERPVWVAYGFHDKMHATRDATVRFVTKHPVIGPRSAGVW